MERNAEITDESIHATVAAGKQYSVRFFKAGPIRNQSAAEAEKIQKEHLRYLFRLKSDGMLLINGPVLNDPVLKGVSIFNTTDLATVKRLSDADPAVISGRLVYEIYHWFSTPGDCLP